MAPADPPDPLEVAARALRHRDRSRRQVAERLERAGVEPAAQVEALDTLERVGYVDDSRYAAGRAAALAARGYGNDAIRDMLAADGVAPEPVEAAVAAVEPERARAARLVGRLGASPRTLAQLRRKGFAEDSIEEAAPHAFAADEPDA